MFAHASLNYCIISKVPNEFLPNTCPISATNRAWTGHFQRQSGHSENSCRTQCYCERQKCQFGASQHSLEFGIIMLVVFWRSAPTLSFEFFHLSMTTFSEWLQFWHFFVRIFRHWFLATTFWTKQLQSIHIVSQTSIRVYQSKIIPQRVDNIFLYWYNPDFNFSLALPDKMKLSERNSRRNSSVDNRPMRQRMPSGTYNYGKQKQKLIAKLDSGLIHTSKLSIHNPSLARWADHIPTNAQV